RRALLTAVIVSILAAGAHAAGEIGFEEEFALATDRTVPLKQLIPGTEDYYYYHCLNFQNTGQFDEVEKMLPQWIKRYKYTARVEEIRNRQALLLYEKQPDKSLELIRRRLGLQFDQQRERLDRKSNLPTELDQKLISRQTLSKRARGRYKNLRGFEDRALDWVTATKLDPIERRDLLSRLKRPDYPNLPRLVVADLKYEHSRGFGALGIHRRLLLGQLEKCLELNADLLNQTKFVQIYLAKLRPGDDVDWRHDPKERQAYLQRQWDFVKRLSPAHNSLKAAVLYHRLLLDRSLGIWDRGRFMEYIKLPRNVFYVRPEYLNSRRQRNYRVNLRDSFQKYTWLPPIVADEPLVRSYLMHFFREADSIKPFDTYIRDDYLKRLFAETKITGGLGDQEQWYSMLTPGQYKALKERVDIDFAPTNKQTFGPQEKVALDLAVKNVKKLIVKVYEINAMNFYRANLKEVDTDINLDGLVANQEKVYTYEEVALRRVRRHFEFPSLKERGVYVVEFIGNGKSSRALIRKGRLRHLVRTSTAGQVFTVLNESNQVLKEATLWVAGHQYQADEEGKITVPFSNKPGRQAVILSHGDFASLSHFQHQAERYSLAAGIHVDRESLLKRKTTQVVIRPVLYLNGEPVTLSVLEDVSLAITSTDREGVSSTKRVPDFKLFEDREALYEFRVPDRLARISFTLKAKVKSQSRNKKVDLAARADFSLNGIDATAKVEDLHLGRIEGGFVLDVLGKTGEARAGRPVKLTLKHRDFRDAEHVSLQSDERGRITLGPLKDIESLTATGPEGASHTWSLGAPWHSYPDAVHGRAGQTIALPYMGKPDKPERAELSLLEMRGSTFLADRFEALTIADGMVRLKGLPAGDYDLLLKRPGRRIRVRLTAGRAAEGYVLSGHRLLEVRNARPLQIASVEADDQAIRIKLTNSSKFARVHVVATRYEPEYSLANLAVGLPGPGYRTLTRPESVYLSGRNIGDEYRYIIDRKYATKYPGNMLTRPGLLLNPWAIRKTETGRQEAAKGQNFFGVGGGVSSYGGIAAMKQRPRAKAAGFANLDFLSRQAAVFWNLEPDAEGVVTIPRANLGDHQEVQVLAVGPLNTAFRRISLPEVKPEFADLRLAAGLDPKGHFTEQKQISVVEKGQTLTVADITTAQFEVYDSLAKVYRLYATLSKDKTLAEFAFILNWPKMTVEEKQKQYSKYACHELSFFIYKKDPKFFKTVVQPYLKNKKDKTFMDHWLIGSDLSGYLKPWNFAQLNIVERALLAQRVDGQVPVMSRHVKELWDLLPPDIEQFNYLFKTALKGGSLETGDELGLLAAKKAARTATWEYAENRKRAAESGASRAAGRDSYLAEGPEGKKKEARAPEKARRALRRKAAKNGREAGVNK
ncbi:MAG: hypothetical protein GWP05_08415, partial [Anaerolineaceae bacterium]|nr:hypothetical protein [Anaerolineaceae bacterium]